MRVAALQHDIVWEDPEANFARLAPQIAAAAATDARLVVLTEMFSTGFSMRTERTAEPVDGPSLSFLVEQAKTHDVWVCASLPEQPPEVDRPYNTCCLVAPDGTVHRYRKIHPFSYAREHEHFAAGDEFVTVEVEGIRVTLFVCYDLRFADEFWATAQRTDCYLVPANWPSPRRRHWTALLDARAIENQAYVIGVNRVGEGGRNTKLAYSGDSRILDPLGEVRAAAAGGEALLVTDIDADHVAEVRAQFPFLPDRR